MNIIGEASITPGLAVTRRRALRLAYDDLAHLRDQIVGLPQSPVRDLGDFRRAGPNAKRAILAALLAAADCGPAWQPETTAVLGWNGDGCATENALFWQDYTANGRTQARGALFVPTLCSVPLCEAAIALGIHGPAVYLQAEADALADALALADTPFIMTITITADQTTATVRKTAHEAETDIPEMA
ncbi:MAG: hypothetical protein PHC30_05830 [Lentisphaeria bacterium]|jgi:hypothetical protein|nr:hypothetical protein [Lentisphaeria bacterium]